MSKTPLFDEGMRALVIIFLGGGLLALTLLFCSWYFGLFDLYKP